MSERVKIVLQLHAPGLDDSQSVYISGSIPELGNWGPKTIRMNSCGDGHWAICLQSKAIPVIEYKFTLGSWNREAADARGQPLANFSIDGRIAQVKKHEVAFWTERQANRTDGQITGIVRYHHQEATENLKPREIVVWLPPDYGKSQDRFPVLYMHDGQNLFDPRTSAFGVDWQIDETLTRLVEAGELPPMIVVGIYNTSDRNKEYLPGEIGKAYRDLLVEQIKPMIDREYRTRPEREHTFVGGSSAGGLCAFILAWEYPNVFSKALCFSPAFKSIAGSPVELDYVEYVANSPGPELPVFFYIDNGGVGLDILLQPGVDAMLEALAANGFRQGRQVIWHRAPEDEHSEKAWASRFPAAVQTLFKAD